MANAKDITLDSLLEFIKESRGFDFTGYKRSSIERRVAKRMQEIGLERYEAYIDHLQFHSGEFAELFNTILINVTGFFRDGQTWEYLASEILPHLVENRSADTPLRIWCAGCSSGEEAYTLAMTVARVVGVEAFREWVKIYATDIDEEALDYARHGAYLPRQVEAVPREALEQFFELTDQRYVFRKDLRRCVIFGRNDLVQDAPISHIDLLVCRNTLMYFTADTQSQILRRFHFALEDHGVLFLGKSEMLISHGDLFTPVDVKRRVFRKVLRPTLRDRVRAIAFPPGNGASLAAGDGLREATFEIGGAAEIVLDGDSALVMANDAARRMFGLGVDDLGRPIQDLEISYRPVELRGHLDSLKREPKTIALAGLRWPSGDQERIVDIRLTPLLGDGIVLGTSVSYLDVTRDHELQEQLKANRRELEEAYEELQSTVEELETTNEELQSTNEELETTNEELQSTNEELETMNEELQSTNEELETMNDELGHRTIELNDTNAFLEAILATVGTAVAVVDRDQRVQMWNENSRDLWGLRSDEVQNHHLLSLDIGLPLEELRPQLRAAGNGDSARHEMVLDATDRRGQTFQCRVTLLPLSSIGLDGGSGLILTMEPVA